MDKHAEAKEPRVEAAHRSGCHMVPLRVLYCDSDVAVGGGGDLFVVVWRDRTTCEGLADMERVFRRFCRNRTRELALVTIVEADAKAPDPEAREALAQLMRSADSHVMISAIVYEETGFVAAAFRGVVTGLSLLARHTFTHRMWKDLPTAAAWIEGEQTRIGKHFCAADIVTVVEHFRRQVNPPLACHATA